LCYIGVSLYRPRRTGERKRKSVRGCICGPDIAALFLRVLEKGPGEVEGLTDAERPRRLGPKRANRIRTAFALRKQDDPRKCVVRRAITKAADPEKKTEEKTFYKSPKVQRLITDKRLRRKMLHKRSKKDGWKATRDAHVAYEKLLSKFLKEKKAAYKASTSKSVPEKATPSPSASQAKKVVDKKVAKPAAKAEVKKEAPKAVAPAAKAGKAGKGKK
jgi:small subunit ribosomal protein S6e